MPPGERKAFLDGMVEPDRHKERMNGPGYSYRISHHRPPRRVVMLHVWMARRAFLINDSYQGCRHLGMALHYIQDRSTSKGAFGLTHDRREKAISELEVPDKAIEKGLGKYVSSPDFVSRCIYLTKPLKRPMAALEMASFRSAAVAAAVMDLRRSPEVKERYREALRRHSLVNVPLGLGSVALGLSLSVLWAVPWPTILAVPFVAIALWADGPYRHLRRLARWYGLRSY